MTTTQSVPSASLTARIASIDVFRGLTMLVMIFANDINDAIFGNIQNSPWWLHHMPTEIDGMTLNDVIFPTFLFIVGLAIPVALERRLARGHSPAKVAQHVLTRAVSLIFIGVCMVNMYGVNEAATGISGASWRLLLLASIIVLCNRYPKSQGAVRWLFVALRVAAVGVLVYVLAIFRGDFKGEVVWLRPQWWGILGLIGWAYFVSAVVWLACRDLGAAIMGALALLIAVRISGDMGLFNWWSGTFHGYLPSPPSIAGLAAAVVGGMAVATIFRPNSPAKSPWSRIAWILLFAAGFAAAGYLLRPLLGMGIHKNSATPAWIFYCLAIACTIYAFLYWLVDVQKIDRWTVLIAPAGSNTLLMYLLPFMLYSALTALGIDYLQTHFNEGWVGVGRSAVIAFCLVGVTGILTRCGIRLQL